MLGSHEEVSQNSDTFQLGTTPDTIQHVVEDIFTSVYVRSSSTDQIVMELEATDMDLFEKLCICLDEMKKANEIARFIF